MLLAAVLVLLWVGLVAVIRVLLGLGLALRGVVLGVFPGAYGSSSLWFRKFLVLRCGSSQY